MVGLFYFRFKVVYYEEMYNEKISVEGIVAGTDFIDTNKRLVKYYGEDNIYKIEVEYIDGAEDVFILKEETLEGIPVKEINKES